MGPASAQTGMWLGVSGSLPFEVSLHLGLEDLISTGINLRANGSTTIAEGGTSGFGLGVDVLLELPVDTADLPVEVYVGGGPALRIATGTLASSLNALVGAEYRPPVPGLQQGGAFLELGAIVTVLPVFIPAFAIRFGVNYHF